MFVIKSYIKYPHIFIRHFKDAQESYFISINNTNEIFHIKNDLDLNYLEGALYLAYKNQAIIDFTHYDLIDQLWGYFLNMIEEFLETKKSEMSFPDQPTPLEMKNLSDYCIIFSVGFTQWTLPKYEFFNALLSSAKDFFEKMMLLVEENNDYHIYALEKIKRLQPKINALKR